MKQNRAPSWYRQQTALLKFLATWGFAGVDEIPDYGFPDLVEQTIERGYAVRAKSPSPNGGGMRTVIAITAMGMTAAKARGYYPNSQEPGTKLLGSFVVARDASGKYSFLGRVVGQPSRTTYLLTLHVPGYLDQTPTRKIVSVESMDGWDFYQSGEDAHSVAIGKKVQAALIG